MSGMGSFKRRLDKFMDEDDRWNLAVVLIQGLPQIGLTASCSFPNFLTFLPIDLFEYLKVDLQFKFYRTLLKPASSPIQL